MTQRVIARRPANSLRRGPRYHDPDWWLLSLLLTLVMFGTVMIFSASFPETAPLTGLSRYGVLIRQMIYAGVGLVGMLIAMRIDYHRYRALAFPMMLGMLFLLFALVMVPVLGTEVYESLESLDVLMDGGLVRGLLDSGESWSVRLGERLREVSVGQ